MDFHWAALWITFQAGFTESFIASSVVVSVGLSRGKKNAIIGTVIGLLASGVLAFILQSFLLAIPEDILNWISSLLLLGFGMFLIYEFVKAEREGEGVLEFQKNPQLRGKTSWGAVFVAAWGVFNEGLEILVVWLAIALHNGPVPATIGAGMGILFLLILAVVFRKMFRFIPPKYLDLLAGAALIIYGVIFGIQAL